jgi:hypothetical protein
MRLTLITSTHLATWVRSHLISGPEMIEIKRRQSKSPEEARYGMVVDGQELTPKQAHAYAYTADATASLRDAAAAALVTAHRVSEIAENITRLAFETDFWSQHSDVRLRPQFVRNKAGDPVRLDFFFAFRVPYWKRPWSMGEFKDEITSVLEQEGLDVHASSSARLGLFPNFAITVGEVDPTRVIGELLDKWRPRIDEIVVEAERRLATRARSDSLVALFEFAPEVRIPCEQYLLYFVEFLKDLGVEAQADLSHDAGRVLFSVTPRSGREALDRIKEALEAYLSLPGATSLGDISSTAMTHGSSSCWRTFSISKVSCISLVRRFS